MILAEHKQLADFPVKRMSSLHKWSNNLGSCYKWCNKKMQVQRFDVVTKQQNYLIEIGKHRLQEHKIFY